MKKTFALLFSIAVLLAGCERYDHAIQDLNDRIEMLEGASIASVEQQIAAINSSLDDLEAADAALSDYTTTLETAAKTLEEKLAATDAQIAALKSELQGENAITKQALLDQLEALKSTIEADLEAINQEIVALKTKDVELEGQIAALKTYVDEQLAALAKEMGTEDWVKATFATLEQYDSLQTELSAIKASIEALNTAIATAETRINNKIATDIAAAISALRAEMDAAVAADIAAVVTELTTAYTEAIATAKEEVTAAYTEAIATAIANSEASMKQWVNETLAQGYYDIATIDGKLAALDAKVDSVDEAFNEKLAAQQAALDQAKSDLTAAYQQAIENAINTNNGIIDTKIAEAVQAALDTVDAKLATINATLADLQSQIDSINSTIATIEQQITNITNSIEDLENVDAALEALIKDLQDEAAALQSELDANAANDAATKQALEAEIAALNSLITALQAKDAELDQQIAALKDYVDGELTATEDWANATFATLTQYTALQTEIATLTALIETYKQELTDDYTAAIEAAVTDMQSAITTLETSMKQWVNETLAQGYYDIATVDGKLAAFDTKVDSVDEAFNEKLAAQQAALDQAKSDLTAAYQQAIENAINTNNGIIDTKIAEAVQAALDTVDAKLATINATLADLQSQIDSINSTIATIEQQITNITNSIEDLENVDAALEALIKGLQDEAAALQSELDDNAAADAATKQALEAEITALNSLITALQAKDAELEQQIAALKSYVDTELAATEDWANATFATLTQYTALQTELATLTALIETYKQELTDDYTAAIDEAVADMQTDLTALEASMKAWVNETLAQGYYDIATINGKLDALQATLAALAANGATDQELADAITAQQAALNAAKSELTAAYQQAIAEAINNNNGVIDTKITNAIATAKAELQNQIDAINTEINTIKDRLTALEGKVEALIARIQSIRFMPEYSDGMVELTSDNAPVTLTFLLSPSAAAQAVASNPGVVTAYISRTQSRTRAADAPTAINVTSVAGTAEGMLTVTVSAASLPADYWAAADEANLFIRISDGNNDVISEMIPACYTVICELPRGTTFRSAVHEQLADNTTAIKFIANSDVVTDKQIGTSPAYMQLNGTTLEIHTRAKGFSFPPNCTYMFSGVNGYDKFAKLTAIDFNDCINTAKVTNMTSMFHNCLALTSLDLSAFNTEKVTSMTNMFHYCSALTSLDLSAFNTEKVTSMGSMFNMCRALTSLNLSSFNTEKVTNMAIMFNYCSALTSLDLSKFNTANVTSMRAMFSDCSALTSLDLSSFNTANVTDMSDMFGYCYALTSLDIRNFDIGKVTNISSIFSSVGYDHKMSTGSKTLIKVTSALEDALDAKGVSTDDYAEYDIIDVNPM